MGIFILSSNIIFSIVKTSANRVGRLDAGFQQYPLVQNFLKLSQYCCETSTIKRVEEKSRKKLKLLQKLPKSDQSLAVN